MDLDIEQVRILIQLALAISVAGIGYWVRNFL